MIRRSKKSFDATMSEVNVLKLQDDFSTFSVFSYSSLYLRFQSYEEKSFISADQGLSNIYVVRTFSRSIIRMSYEIKSAEHILNNLLL